MINLDFDKTISPFFYIELTIMKKRNSVTTFAPVLASPHQDDSLRTSANSAANSLIDSVLRGGRVHVHAGVGAMSSFSNELGIAELMNLKDRCARFGIDASTEEMLLAGLRLLTDQTETALEVALLQSLRSDRLLAKRRLPRD
jgi:hypothetical protein